MFLVHIYPIKLELVPLILILCACLKNTSLPVAIYAACDGPSCEVLDPQVPAN